MNRSYLFVLFFVWIVGVLLGLNYESVFPSLNETSVLSTKLEMKPIFGLQPTVWGFFINNLVVGLLMIVSGWLSAGSLSCIISFWNAFIMGVLINSVISLGYSYTIIAHKVIWHGSIEILALIMFGAIGLKGFHFLQTTFTCKPLKIYPRKILIQTVFATALLFVAAIIESNVI
jgi:uncharacterized membrane protein SpoIIM required for sporulation